MSPRESKGEQMSANRLKVAIAAMYKEGGFVLAEDLVNELRNLIGIVDRLDREASGGRSTMYLRVVDLSLDSPPTAVFEACLKADVEDVRENVMNQAVHLIRRVQEEEDFDERLDNQLLKFMEGFARPIGTSVASVQIEASRESGQATSALRDQLTRVTSPIGTYDGFMRGRLEWLNVHGDARKFRIYPADQPFLSCHFPERMYVEALAAVGKRVQVEGTLQYRLAAKHPHAMEVEKLTPLLPDSELPGFEDLRGIARDMTGDLLSEEFIREFRDSKEEGKA